MAPKCSTLQIVPLRLRREALGDSALPRGRPCNLHKVLSGGRRWRPGEGKSKVLGVCSATGVFDYLHVPSLRRLFSIEERENSLHCCDFAPSGNRFATAGRDCHIRIYD